MLNNQIMSQTAEKRKLKTVATSVQRRCNQTCVCMCVVPPQGIQRDESHPSTPRLTVWSWSWSHRWGAGSRDAWHVSPGCWLMPLDRLRLQGCVQRLRVCISVCVAHVCLGLQDVRLIRIMGGKEHSWGGETTAALFVCLSKWHQNSKVN